jgi:integrase
MEQFRADLKAANIDEEDGRGRKVVLHSLRHSLATMLAQSKVPPAIAMKILRHRDIRLTMHVYADEGLLSTSAAMASLPSLSAGDAGEERRSARA